jgi:hypothetical protein
VTYEFADPEIEELSAAQRQLLRFGPDNVTTIQQKLSEIRAALAENPQEASAEEE